MARIRTIKPEFWVDEKIVELSFGARLLFIGLWNFADDYGRMEYRINKIKMQIFPADSLPIPPLFEELVRGGFVTTYVIDSNEFLQINGFDKHQKIDSRSVERIPPNPNPTESRLIPPNSAGKVLGKGKGKVKGKGNGGEIKKTYVKKFEPPSIDEVNIYCNSRKNTVDAEQFVAFYTAKDWMIGKNKMKCWKSAIITWEKRTDTDERPNYQTL